VFKNLTKNIKFFRNGFAIGVGGLLSVTIGLVGLWFFLVPPQVSQSPADLIANQGLSSMLTELGANGLKSVCWLGDPDKKFVHQFLGSHESAWSRLKENLRVHLWQREGSCFEKNITAAVVLFPYVESSSLSKKEAAKIVASIQRETSVLLSQTGSGADFEKQSSTFHLQTGANFQLYTRRPSPIPSQLEDK
jgi:hypothetical protein